MDDAAERIRTHRLAHGIPGGRGLRAELPSLGVKNKDAAQLTGYGASGISNAAARGKFTRHEDGSYCTPEFESWVRSRGVPNFVVPPALRGALYRDDDFDEIPEHQRGTTNALELLQLKVQAMRLKVAHQARQLEADQAKYVRRDVMERTVRDGVQVVCETAQPVGGELAASLVGLSDEFEIKRRIDAEMRALLKRMQARVAGMIEPSI